MIDYRKLLWKYINHVGNEESITFISRIDLEDEDNPFSWEELAELHRLEKATEDEVDPG